jgi:hypothetical protein
LFKSNIKVDSKNVDLAIRENENIHLNSKSTPCSTTLNFSTYLKCGKTYMKSVMLPNMKCTLPGIEEFFVGTNIGECTDKKAASYSFVQFLISRSAFLDNSASLTCDLPCSETNYIVEPLYYHANSWIEPDDAHVLKDGHFNLRFFYNTLVVEEKITSLVYDTGTLLTSAGGNMSLFLGFSCLSVLLSLIRNASHWTAKYK